MDLISMIEAYYLAGEPEKGSALCSSMADDVLNSCYNVLAVLVSVADEYGGTDLASSIRLRFNELLD